MLNDIYLPQEAEIIDRIDASENIFTLRLKLFNNFKFIPGQFNMLYLFGVGEVAISISSDPDNHENIIDHTIRMVGRVTNALAQLKIGDYIGVRGPYGKGWPLEKAKKKDVIIITGGLGCAPVISVIDYIMRRRDQYGALKILQGVKHSNDLIYRDQYQQWKKSPNTEVLIAADQTTKNWQFLTGHITDMITHLNLKKNSLAMMCGPEIMMQVATQELIKKNIVEAHIYLNMERNMECAVGHCGHCQFGGKFICKDGPVFSYPSIKSLLGQAGF